MFDPTRPQITLTLSLVEAMDLRSALIAANYVCERDIPGLTAWVQANGSQADVEARDRLAALVYDTYKPFAREMTASIKSDAEKTIDELRAEDGFDPPESSV